MSNHRHIHPNIDHTDRQTGRQADIHTHRHRQTHTDTHRHTDRHTDTQTDRHTDRQTHRHTHTNTHTHTHTNLLCRYGCFSDTDAAPVTAALHWHSHGVNALTFTNDGAYLLSGTAMHRRLSTHSCVLQRTEARG